MNYYEFAVLLAILTPVLGNADVNRRIIGGDLSPPLPFFVQLNVIYPKKEEICGASLLTPNGAVTAAHCLFKCKSITAFFGSETRGEGLTRKAKAWQWHKNYDAAHQAFDIGVLVWTEAVPFSSTISPIAIGPAPAVGTKVTVAGFGFLNRVRVPSDFLRSVQVTFKDNETCKKTGIGLGKFLKKAPKDSFLCSHDEPYKGTCVGDSGGPMFSSGTKPLLYGITSLGPPDCNRGGIIYSSASFFSKSIQDTIKCLLVNDQSKCVMN